MKVSYEPQPHPDVGRVPIKLVFFFIFRTYMLLLYPLFSLEKKGILISCQSRSVVRPSVRLSVRPCVRPSVTFLVNVSPPKPLEVATSNLVDE